jgi:acid phosphatase family membrane protein YuiD
MTTPETSVVAQALQSLIENKIFLSAVTSLLVAQILKMLFFLLSRKNKRALWETLEMMIWRTGGMPSSHSAIVCSLAASAGLYEGIASNYFVFSLVFAMVVLRDSVGVRRAAGLQAKALNTLGKQTEDKLGLEFHSVKEIQGHTPLEVLVGALLGILIAAIFYLI